MKSITRKTMPFVWAGLLTALMFIPATSFALTITYNGGGSSSAGGNTAWNSSALSGLLLPGITSFVFGQDDIINVSPETPTSTPDISLAFDIGSTIIIGGVKKGPLPPAPSPPGQNFEHFYINDGGVLREVTASNQYNSYYSSEVLSAESITFRSGSSLHLSFDNFSEVAIGDIFLLGTGLLTIESGVLTDLAPDLILAIDTDGQKYGVMKHAPVPEPSTVLLFGAGLSVLASVGRAKRRVQ